MTLNPQQFQQLPMFMSAREITDTASPGDRPYGDDEAAVWRVKGKSAFSKKAGAYGRKPTMSLGASIGQEGVQRPVDIVHTQTGEKPTTLVQGHHRVAYSLENDPDRLIPVVHHEEPAGRFKNMAMQRVEQTISSARAFGWRDAL